MNEIRENVKLSFTVPCEITEGLEPGKWLCIGGTALVEGKSANNNIYTFTNLAENDGKEFKWLVGHPDEPEEHVVGLGKLSLQEGKLCHTGKIKNTARHPDIMEQVKDKLLGPSIHASAKKITKSKEGYLVEGLSIDGVGLVAFQGVKDASIDYAIAESFDKKELMESSENEDDEANNEEDETMAEEAKTPDNSIVESKDKEIASLQAEIARFREEKKTAIVSKILEANKDMKKEDLMKESEDKLNLILEYETKLAAKVKANEGQAIVEAKVEEKPKTAVVEQNDGSITIDEATRVKFNNELKELYR